VHRLPAGAAVVIKREAAETTTVVGGGGAVAGAKSGVVEAWQGRRQRQRK
jgi:hypothetical protein